MSLIRDPVNITSTGRQMMTAGGDITYTKATLYGQDISHLTKEQIESLTSIGNPLLTVPVGISDKSDNDNATTVVIEATFQNANLKADLPYTAVGFFAKRGDDAEKLVLVGVANPGAYLVATSPDGIATDALDIKVAIAIGDATSVTAVVDPAGSVTPATLNGAINKLDHDLTARIDVKADNTTVESVLATKANQSDLDQTNAEVAKKANSEDVTSQLATKANSSDVAASVKSLTDSIATKADAKTVNDAISKIDFTPYAKTADVDSKLQGYTNTADLTKLLDVKANAVDVYSKTELDKKLLALSTDTDGKVNVDQVSSMIANKVDKSDLASDLKAVNDSIATKANSSDVNSALAKKDDTSDVDAKIKTVTDLANTKASTTDVASQISASEDKLNKVIATKANTADVDAKIKTVTDLANTKANSVDVTAALDKKDDTSDVDAKIKTVTDLANTKANANDVYNRSTVDNAFTDVRGRLSKLEGTQTLDSPDFNSITASGVYYITNNNGANIKNNPVDHWGVLIVSNGAGHRTSQMYFPDDGSALYMRELDETTWHGWIQLATTAQVNDAKNTANWDNINGRPQDQINRINVDGPLFKHLTQFNNWGDLFDGYSVNGVTATNGSRLVAFRDDTNGGNTVGSNGAGIGFGGGDTKGVLSVDYWSPQARITGGNGTAPTWSEDIAWKSDINDLRNQIQQLKDNQFEVQTFTDTTAAANWEAQKPGHRLAIVNK